MHKLSAEIKGFLTKHTSGHHIAYTSSDSIGPFRTEIELVQNLGKLGIDLKKYHGEGHKVQDGGPYDVITVWIKKS